MSKGAKGAKKSGNKGGKKASTTVRGKKIKGNKTRKTFNSYIRKVSKRSCNSKAVRVLNSLCQDQLNNIAVQAAALVRSAGKQTMKSADVQAAVRMLFPADLAKHVVAESGKAVAAYLKAKPAKKSAPKRK